MADHVHRAEYAASRCGRGGAAERGAPGDRLPLTTAKVIADGNAAPASLDRDTMLSLAGALDRNNNLDCPLD